jgi:hypothetical protein
VEEVPVRFAIIPLIGIDLPNRVFGMATGGDAMGLVAIHDAVLDCRGAAHAITAEDEFY